MKTTQRNLFLALLLLIAVGMGNTSAWAQGISVTSSTSGTTTTFTITRSGSILPAQTVNYRTVSLSAIEGQHFTAASGTLTFAADETSKTVTVTESTPVTDAYKYQTATSRTYRFEVLDRDGYVLAARDRTMTTGTSVPSSGAFNVKDVTIYASEYTADDDGYDVNGYKSVASSAYFTSGNAPKAYLQHVGAQLRMTLSFQAKENDDGYQYLQLLFDNTSSCDNRSGCSNGDPGNISLSTYMAGFEILSGSKDADYKNYTFPVLTVGNNAGATDPFVSLGTNTYAIATKTDLRHLALLVNVAKNACTGLTFRQTQDITCDDTYTPIGYYVSSSDKAQFKGTYDGQGYTVSGITVNRTGNTGADDSVGFFGYVYFESATDYGTVRNVVLASSTFTGHDCVGGIVGYNRGGTVENCRVESTVTINASTNSAYQHGGIVGDNWGGNAKVIGCYSAAVVSKNGKSTCKQYGGIVGRNSNGTVKDCLYAGTTVTADEKKGAIVGGDNNSNGTFTNNYYTAISLGGVNGSDQDGARRARTVSLDDGVAIAGTQTAYSASGLTAIGTTALQSGTTIYSGEGQTLTLSYSGEVPTGYCVVYSATAGTLSGSTLTMPAGNVTINAALGMVRSITGYGESTGSDHWAFIATPVAAGSAIGAVTFSTTAPELSNGNGSLQIVLTQAVERAKVPEPVEGPKGGVSTSSTTATLDNAIVSFNEGSQLGKFRFLEQAANISIPQGGEEYAIVSAGRDAKFCVSTEVPINFKAKVNGEYTITVNPEGVEMDYLHLIDNLTGADVDLLTHSAPEPVEGPNASEAGPSTGTGTSYTFAAKTTDSETRFKLVFRAEKGYTTTYENFAYINNGEIVIVGDACNASLQVVDVLGRIAYQGDAMHCVSTGRFVPGVYVLRLIEGKNIKAQKIVIQ